MAERNLFFDGHGSDSDDTISLTSTVRSEAQAEYHVDLILDEIDFPRADGDGFKTHFLGKSSLPIKQRTKLNLYSSEMDWLPGA